MGILHFIITCLLFLKINSENYEIEFCCCIYSKDPFRGFQTISSDILNYSVEQLDKEFIAKKLLNNCLNQQGFPSEENMNRIQNRIFKVAKNTCEKECSNLMIELNDIYHVKQEENRLQEAKKLRELRKKYISILDKKLIGSANKLKKGDRSFIFLLNKPNINSKNDLILQSNDSCDIGMGNKINSYTGDVTNKKCNILTSKNSSVKYQSNFSPMVSNINDNLDDTNIMSPESEKQKLDIQIMYLEKKNRRPIDFILDRFNIQDEILVFLIKIFETTLDDVIKKRINYLEESYIFQFNDVERTKRYFYRQI